MLNTEKGIWSYHPYSQCSPSLLGGIFIIICTDQTSIAWTSLTNDHFLLQSRTVVSTQKWLNPLSQIKIAVQHKGALLPLAVELDPTICLLQWDMHLHRNSNLCQCGLPPHYTPMRPQQKPLFKTTTKWAILAWGLQVKRKNSLNDLDIQLP